MQEYYPVAMSMTTTESRKNKGVTAAARVLSLVVVALGARTAFLFIGLVVQAPGVKHYAIETSTVWFIAAGLLLAALRRSGEGADGGQGGEICWISAVWVGAAVLLFLPTMRVGLLSDDYVLVQRINLGQFGFINPESLRPIPLLLWRLLLGIGSGPLGLHLLNVLIHGLNAWLTYRLALAFVPPQWAILAGALLLTSPLSPEPVVWCAAVFDVTATLFALMAILVARKYSDKPSLRRRISFVVLVLASLFSKEIGVVVPALALCDAFARRSIPKPLQVDSIILCSFGGLVGLIRLHVASAAMKQPITKYVIQRWLFGTAGSLLAPAHIDVIRDNAWLPSTEAIVLVSLALSFFLFTRSTAALRTALSYAAFSALGSLPTVAFFYIGPDLQQSRYLYLSSVGYACVLSVVAHAVAGSGTRAGKYIGATAGLMLLAMNATLLRMHEAPWVQASIIRDEVVDSVASRAAREHCRVVAVVGLPDNYQGAYVFRNGAVEAMRDRGVSLVDAAPQRCSVEWPTSSK